MDPHIALGAIVVFCGGSLIAGLLGKVEAMAVLVALEVAALVKVDF